MKRLLSILIMSMLLFSIALAWTSIGKAVTPPTVEWQRTYGGTGFDNAFSVIQTSDGGYALVGATGSFGAGSNDFWFVKTDAIGSMQWNQTYGGTGDEEAWSVLETRSGGYAIAGETSSFGAGGYDAWLVQTDADGSVMWNSTYGGTSDDRARSMVQTCDGGYAIAGGTESFGAGGRDYWLVKLAPEGISASIDIDPDTLNLRSNGRWVTAHIELPGGYDVSDINGSTMMLNSTVPVDLSGPEVIGDYDGDGVPDFDG
jgi:hypothetical protein